MALKDISGKTIYDLDLDDFKKLYCRHCKENGTCLVGSRTINACMGLIDSGVWDTQLRKRTD